MSILGCSPGNGVCVFNPGNFISISAAVNFSSNGYSNEPTGTITFYSNGTPLTAALPIDSSVNPPGAGFSTTQLLGQNSITAQYSGDSNYTGSTSSATLVDVGLSFSTYKKIKNQFRGLLKRNVPKARIRFRPGNTSRGPWKQPELKTKNPQRTVSAITHTSEEGPAIKGGLGIGLPKFYTLAVLSRRIQCIG